MLKHAALAIVLASSLPALAQAPVETKPAAGATKKYENKEWNFSAIFPYTIKESPGENGGLTVSAANPEDTIAYMLSVFPLADEVLKRKSQDKILEDAVQGAVDNVKGTLLSKSVISIDGYPGRQFDIKSDQFIAKCRIYLVKNRMYLPMVIANPSLKLPIESNDFHANFKLLKK
jgi:hypothetical protein